jgi:hypothetical protein
LTKLEEVEEFCASRGIVLEHSTLPGSLDSIYYETVHTHPVITVDSSVTKHAEQIVKIAEELGHHYTTSGNLLTDKRKSKVSIRKQEQLARRWAFRYTVSLSGIVDAYQAGAHSLHEMAEFMGIEMLFLAEALDTYGMIYGKETPYGNLTIHFDPVFVTCEGG